MDTFDYKIISVLNFIFQSWQEILTDAFCNNQTPIYFYLHWMQLNFVTEIVSCTISYAVS